MKNIACIGNGIYTSVGDNDNFDPIFTSFYSTLAAGLTIKSARWTEPYEDANGLGRIVSVVYPIYDTTGDYTELVGVASMDLQMSIFDELDNPHNIQAALLSGLDS